ncbi:hypothetical protein M758_1G153100 [Ceratodon purpureus]|nr:hypothetical protein M758_1G153100 [Ceratodon purpureus]
MDLHSPLFWIFGLYIFMTVLRASNTTRGDMISLISFFRTYMLNLEHCRPSFQPNNLNILDHSLTLDMATITKRLTLPPKSSN